MISSSEGCRIMSGGKKDVSRDRSWRYQAGPLNIRLHAPRIEALQGSSLGWGRGVQ